MTIFLTVLKKLIKEKLTTTSKNLKWQAQYPLLYTQALSLQKQHIIDLLEIEIQDFKGSDDDEADAVAIKKIIGAARVKIQDKHEQHQKPRDEGDTLDILSNLIFHIDAFYTKLSTFNDKMKAENRLILINKSCNCFEPASIIYYHSACYLAEEIFNPSSTLDTVIRNAKEEAVRSRIQALSERIKPEMELEERKEKAMEALKDLSTDNQNIINPKSKGGFSLPFFSFGGVVSVKLPSEWFNPSEGRFGQEFSLAVSLVQELSEYDFKTKFKGEVVELKEQEDPSRVTINM
ncbi:hypothetical protein [Legionella fallonii]|uniref:Uncharacterized protein n=1 Tax=Legionella fallonii LLAP-10 TaxID=1212491 RepID=A0A098GA91_9GAMM|nr:hypothetical protein [Legionella fallonii]CEG58935.1 conserved protein of unknown function [Legionella fallonii LLAP-10]